MRGGATTSRALIDGIDVHDYDADRLSRGAYSYTRVGGTAACETLARPLAGGRLIFAGEATDARYQGTVAGALASGVRAAAEVAAAAAHS